MTGMRQYTDIPAAVSGACATIASDALMNPFDGTASRFLKSKDPLTLLGSRQATNAASKHNLPYNRTMRQRRLSARRYASLLRILPDDPCHDRPLHGHPIHSLRVRRENTKPVRQL